jgi:hypothetical protein
MGAYVILLLVSVALLNSNPTAPWRGLVAVLPAIPIILVLVVVVRFMGRLDELQRRIQLDAIAFAFGATAIVTFTWGLLETAGFPRLSPIWVLLLMSALWGSQLSLHRAATADATEVTDATHDAVIQSAGSHA